MPPTDSFPEHVKRPARHRSWLNRLLTPGISVVHLDVRIAELPRELDGFCLAQISDLHVRDDELEPERVAEAVRVIRGAAPSLLLNSGDFLQGEPPLTDVCTRVNALQLRQEDCEYQPANIAVLGNHDYVAGPPVVRELVRQLQSLGVCVLLNDAVAVTGPKGIVNVIGLTVAHPGFPGALEQLRSASHPRIALIHEPEVAERIPAGSADLILAGHTHGGQISIPGLRHWAVKRFAGSHYVSGLYRVNEMLLYVNRGLGTTGPPIRFGAAPEVTLVRLVR